MGEVVLLALLLSDLSADERHSAFERLSIEWCTISA